MKSFLYLLLLLHVLLLFSACAKQDDKTACSGNMVIRLSRGDNKTADEIIGILSRAEEKIVSKTSLQLDSKVIVDIADSEVDFRTKYKKITANDPREEILAVAFTEHNLILVKSTSITAIGKGNLPETLYHETL
ncbi:MAG: hypothetical protein ABIH42_10795, partial [Planctomycetota bacterium]